MSKLLNWADYSASNKDKSIPLLYPISLGFNDKGQLVRERTRAQDVEKIFEKGHKSFPKYISALPEYYADPKKVFSDYINFFEGDRKKGSTVSNIGDLFFKRKVWILYSSIHKSWSFQKGIEFKALNDETDDTRNIVKICTFNRNRALLLDYRHRSKSNKLALMLRLQDDGKSNDEPHDKRFCQIQGIDNRDSGLPM